MCLTIALAFPGMALACADTRWTYPGESCDWGQKVRRVPGGWGTATGSAALAALGLRALEATGVTDVSEAREGVREVCERVRDRVLAATSAEHVGNTKFLLAREDVAAPSVHLIRADGGGDDYNAAGGGQLVTTWAPGMEWCEAESTAELKERLGAQNGSVEGILRTLGWALNHARQYGSDLSAEIEIGFSVVIGSALQALYLRAPAEWLESASDSQILQHLGAPPLIAPFPQLPSEQILINRSPEPIP